MAAFLETLDPAAAARKVGFTRSVAYVGHALMKRPAVKALIQAEIAARRDRFVIDADLVLERLVAQLSRLSAILGHDIAELYGKDGKLLPVDQWGDVWRRYLVSEVYTEETFEYSKDGVQAGASKTWDVAGHVTKIKRVDTLAIEKQITAVLGEIGRPAHV